MKKLHFSLLALFILLAAGVQAAWLNDEPETVTQPDGTVIHCFATGDEFYNWLHDASNFTIIQDSQSGYYTYAVLQNGILKSSDLIVGRDDPAAAGLHPGINISADAMKERRRQFMEKQMPAPPQLPGYSAPGSGRNIGTMNNLVVYVRFADQQEYTADTMLYYDMFNDTTYNVSSMVNYFEYASYGKLHLPSHFYPVPETSTIISYQDIYPRAYFMPYNAVTNPEGYQESERTSREHKLLMRAIEYIEAEVPESLDIDYNNDGYVDNVVFIVKGGTTAWSTLLWPHRWSLFTENVYIRDKRVYDYNFQLETHLNSSGVGVLCHEMNHSLGAPDLYHYNSHPVTPIGDWDVMAANHNPPQLMSSYMKFRYGGWIDNIPEITECGVYTLNPLSEEYNNCYKIASPNSATDYFVIEYRRKEGVFESTLPSSGLLIYKVNGQQNGSGNAQGPPDELYVYRPGGSLTVNGSLSQAAFAEDFGRTEFNDNTDPNCFLSNGQPGGIDISNVSAIGETISFEVNFEKAPIADFSASKTLVTGNCSVDFTDLSLCNVDEWNWEFEGAAVPTSTDPDPTGIYWENEGVYDVSLTVSNVWGTNTIVYEDMITVSASALPEVEFSASDTLICTGQTISLTDESEVCPSGWEWVITPATVDFVNGTTAQDQNPEVQFNEAGYYTVSLTVTNDNGSVELTKEDYVFAGGIPVFDSYTESFENGSFAADGWQVNNPDDDVTWDIWEVNGSGAGTHAAVMNFFDYFSFNQRDQLISPPFDLTGVSTAILSFKHAYSRINTQYTDSLIVKISGDCGDSWTRLLAVADDGSGNFVTAEPINFGFIPQTPDDWCGSGFGADCFNLDISQWTGMRNVRIMFETVCVIGNNLFIDDVKVQIPEGTPEAGSSNHLNIFPNPSKGLFTVSSTGDLQDAVISVTNISGQRILEKKLQQNTGRFMLDLSGYPKGLYFVRITGTNYTEARKVIVE